jgi:AraC-like DNA-binding protein
MESNLIYNFHQQLRDDLNFNKFEVRDLLFIEYNCPLDVDTIKIWSKYDYIIYVLSGRKTWKTTNDSFTISSGEALYVKKGANVIKQYIEEDFCMLGFFITDDVIKNTVQEIQYDNIVHDKAPTNINLVPLSSIPNLDVFYQSMLSYFRFSQSPMSNILELKAKELLLNIISSGLYPGLSDYFRNITLNPRSVFTSIMEDNFSFNLKLEEFAALCNRSLSSFKRDFKNIYGTTPGKWLLGKRLENAAKLLSSTDISISNAAYDSGFEDLSHFSRSFKEKFGVAPISYKKQLEQ